MADRMATNVDFNDVDTSNLHLPKVATNPTDAQIAEIYFNTTTKAPIVHIGASQEAPLARVFTKLVGDGVATSIVVTHNLNSTAVGVDVIVVATGVASATVTSITRTSANVVTIVFSGAPATNAVNVVIMG